MKSPLSWTGRQLAAFWLGALALSTALLIAGTLMHPDGIRVFWLFPTSPGLFAKTALNVFREYPLEMTALVIVPVVALVVTLAWTAAHVSQRVSEQIS